LIVHYTEDGVHLAIWASGPKWLGKAIEAYLGKSVDEVLPEAMARVIKESIREALATSKLVTFCVSEYEGEVAPAEKGSVVCALRDGTEVARLREHVAFQERLAAMGVIAAGVAHEINNSLTSLTANLESLSHLALAGDTPNTVAEAREGARRITAIVGDLGRFSRAEAEAGPVDLRKVVASCVRMLKAQIRSRARVVIEDAEISPVVGTESRLAQVVFNLVLNAAQAVPEGRPHENVIKIAVRQEARIVVLSVSDTGEGLTPEARTRLFEPFHTTKSHGTGLGLFVTRGIVQDLGGTIEARDASPRGTIFTVRFPASERPVRPRRETTPRGIQRRRVLIVDDEELILSSLARLVRPLAAVQAQGVDRALEILEGDREFDIVLCDLMMPGRTGMELFEQVSTRWPELAPHFVFMTGGLYTDRARDFVARTDNAVLEKPITKSALLALMDKLDP
jgi:signal transduction histidine kinase/CheY-like chemotaxis protein